VQQFWPLAITVKFTVKYHLALANAAPSSGTTLLRPTATPTHVICRDDDDPRFHTRLPLFSALIIGWTYLFIMVWLFMLMLQPVIFE
jgi:hypothetical protein